MVAFAATMQLALLLSFFVAATGVFTPGVPAKASSRKAASGKAFPMFEDGDEDPDEKGDEDEQCENDVKDLVEECGETLGLEEGCPDRIAEINKECKDKDRCEAVKKVQEVCKGAEDDNNADNVAKCAYVPLLSTKLKCNQDRDQGSPDEAEKEEAKGAQDTVDSKKDPVRGVDRREEPEVQNVIDAWWPWGVPQLSKDKCTKRDKMAMFKLGGGSTPGSFPHFMARCANQAFHIFAGLNATSFGLCMRKETRITMGCAACFAGASASQAFWCGGACMFSWCSQPCLACTQAYRATHLKSCVGFAAPEPNSC